MKEYTKEERYNIAYQLDNILAADLDLMEEEEAALEAAIAIISPEYVADKQRDEDEAVEWYNSRTPEQMDEETRQFLEQLRKDGADE